MNVLRRINTNRISRAWSERGFGIWMRHTEMAVGVIHRAFNDWQHGYVLSPFQYKSNCWNETGRLVNDASSEWWG